MRYLTLGEVVELHRLVLAATGGAPGIRDLGVLESAVAQPRATPPQPYREGGRVGLRTHSGARVVDGNKRVAHAAMATFLLLNGREIDATVDEQERLMLDLASGRLSSVDLTGWLQQHVQSPPDQAV
jgi:death on curing protein